MRTVTYSVQPTRKNQAAARAAAIKREEERAERKRRFYMCHAMVVSRTESEAKFDLCENPSVYRSFCRSNGLLIETVLCADHFGVVQH